MVEDAAHIRQREKLLYENEKEIKQPREEEKIKRTQVETKPLGFKDTYTHTHNGTKQQCRNARINSFF